MKKSTKRVFSVALALGVAAFGGGLMPVSASQDKGEAPDSAIGELFGEQMQDSDESISRQAFFAAVAKTCYLGEDVSSLELPFADAKQADPELVSYLKQAYVMGILAGSRQDEGLYLLPEQDISRQEASAILGRALAVASNAPLAYTDEADIAPYAYAYIAALEEKDIISGYPDGSFRPQDPISFYEAGVLCGRTLTQQKQLQAVAGDGTAGYEDGASLDAKLMYPKGLAFFADGSLAVADTHNSLLRKVNLGNVTTISGHVLERDENGFAKMYCLDGALEDSLLGRPYDLIFDPGGSMVFTDMGNHTIKIVLQDRLYTLSGGQGTNTAGYLEGSASEALYNSPTGLAADRDSNVYVADTMNQCIRKIDFNGNSSLLAGIPGQAGFQDGAGQQAMFNEPMGLDIDQEGNLYVADSGNNCIRKITPQGEVSTLVGTPLKGEGEEEPDGEQGEGTLSRPTGICVTKEALFIADTDNNAVKMFSQGKLTTVADEEDGLSRPYDVGYQDGKLYIADTHNHRILGIRLAD